MSSLIKNMSFYTIGNILPQAAGFILLPIYSRYLTPADYGIVTSMQVLISVFGILFTLARLLVLNQVYSNLLNIIDL